MSSRLPRLGSCFLVAVLLIVGGHAGAVELRPFISGLSNPVYLTHSRDGTGRLFIVEQAGVIKVLAPGVAAPTVFLDVSDRALFGGEQGLLGLTFHPQYATNGRFFVHYTQKPDGAIAIAEYQRASDPNLASRTETRLLTIPHPTFSNHNAGMIEFGPDGFLYFGVGDGGAGNDPGNNAQNLGVLLGKISRIDVNSTSPGLPYGIPTDNPFVGVSGARAEIFALGLRNPFRFSFDRGTGQLVAGDVGQGAWEEIDVITRGGNFGWRVFEGNHCTNIDPGRCVAGSFVPPIAEYVHDAGRCSVTGGYVYRGTRGTLPLGTYLFADFCTGEIFTLNAGAPSVLLDTGLSISSFGEDEAGELYVVDLGGAVQQLASGSDATLVGAVLPSSRSVTIGTPATAFATIINTSDVTAIGCSLSVSVVALPAAFAYQTTDPTTNAVTGTPNTPVNITPRSSQSFVFAPTTAVASTAFPIGYQCENSPAGPFFAGVNEFRFSADATPTPDVVALAATLTNDGIVNISGIGGTGAFAVATVNVGSGGLITASLDTGDLSLPVTVLICQTNPVSGVCLSPPASTVSTQIDAGATPTFAILVTANGSIPFDPAIGRVFVRFKDAGNIVRGATSVAVRTQ